jgi:pyridoxamine 5'-phosphate oxidase
LKMPMFALGTIASKMSGSEPVPRVRYCVFRGMWTHADSDARNLAEANPNVYESDCLMMTTDARMSKVHHLFHSPCDGEDVSLGSGGGGSVEGVFWMPEAMTQWRIAGDAWVVAPDIDDISKDGVKLTRERLTERMRVLEGKKMPEWSWSRELTHVFGAQSPAIRGILAS